MRRTEKITLASSHDWRGHYAQSLGNVWVCARCGQAITGPGEWFTACAGRGA